MSVQLLQVPYHHGRERSGIGRGPDRLVSAGMGRQLRDRGHEVVVERVDRPSAFSHEIGAAMDLNSVLSDRVQATVQERRFPLVLAGDCNSSLGTCAGLGAAVDGSVTPPGIVWFDAHGDYNTPDTSASGFFDGMALATLTGSCWDALCSGLPSLTPVPVQNALLVGTRELDGGEADRVEHSRIAHVDAGELTEPDSFASFVDPLSSLQTRVDGVYLHIDLDVLDATRIGPANGFAPPGGLSLDLLQDAIRMVGKRFEIRAAALTAYDPTYDEDERVLTAAFELAATICDQIDAD
ncbi:hypothetical protein C2R22_12955 [Salinigranum rubrum]|uniref:Arginase n=1 Tax=Salinigranum rubrum TaxID=755307 RepID=A0A2I8VKI2_9EURY|nr:arginase family protein [Salinigranum rubrum]AUV82437.1 hypothetical protein C2R22_12955 [Salinigranum rubrum]